MADKLTIARVEFGATAADTKVILSNGAELGGLTEIEMDAVNPMSKPTVALRAVLTGEKAGAVSVEVEAELGGLGPEAFLLRRNRR